MMAIELHMMRHRHGDDDGDADEDAYAAAGVCGDNDGKMLWAIILGMGVLHSTYWCRCSCNSRCSVFLRGDVGYVSIALEAIL